MEKSVYFKIDGDGIRVTDCDGHRWVLGFTKLRFDEWGRLIGEVVDSNNKKGKKRKFQLKFPSSETPLWFFAEACKDIVSERDAKVSVKFNVWVDGKLFPAYVHPRRKRRLGVSEYAARVNINGKLVSLKVRQDSEGKLYGVPNNS